CVGREALSRLGPRTGWSARVARPPPSHSVHPDGRRPGRDRRRLRGRRSCRDRGRQLARRRWLRGRRRRPRPAARRGGQGGPGAKCRWLAVVMAEAASAEVLTLGECLVALVASETGPLAETSVFESHVAGAEANVAVGLTRLNHRVAYIGRVGADGFGTAILRRLRGEGVV